LKALNSKFAIISLWFRVQSVWDYTAMDEIDSFVEMLEDNTELEVKQVMEEIKKERHEDEEGKSLETKISDTVTSVSDSFKSKDEDTTKSKGEISRN